MKRSLLLFFLPFFVITYVSTVLFQQACDYGRSSTAVKEIDFNHKNHLAPEVVAQFDVTCETCHGYYDNGRFKGTPTVATCFECHPRTIKRQSTDELPVVNELIGLEDDYKPWGAYAAQPDLAYFSHAVVMNAEFDDGRQKVRCGSCHGGKEVSETTEMITGKMLMGQCEDCHTALFISNKCAVCHD